ncbi:MAG: M23 family metallopeptidase [Acidimicrobiia bacterium]
MATTKRSRALLRACAALTTLLLLATACDSGSESSSDATGDEATSVGTGSDTDTAASIEVPDAYTAVVADVLGAPTYPFLGTDGDYHVAYDLGLQNTSVGVDATITQIEVVAADDPSTVVHTVAGGALVDPDCVVGDCDRLRNLTGQPVESSTIEPQGGRMVFIDFSAPEREDLPDNVLHRIVGQGATSPASQEPSDIDYLAAPYDISAGEAPVIGPPLAGDNWVALNGCCDPGFPHRSSPGPFNGKIVNGQRFAIDWKQMNDDGEFFEGDPNSNESYVDYGADILAVADGTVVATLDGMPANEPGVLPADDPELRDQLTVETVDGNHIVLDLGNGVYAFYAHLQAGTLEVEEGDTVERGDKLAELGNTGNANASHLHFHLMDGPSVLGSNGLPYVIDEFDFAGQVDPQTLIDSDDFLSGEYNTGQLADPESRTDESPLQLNIIDFPAGG